MRIRPARAVLTFARRDRTSSCVAAAVQAGSLSGSRCGHSQDLLFCVAQPGTVAELVSDLRERTVKSEYFAAGSARHPPSRLASRRSFFVDEFGSEGAHSAIRAMVGAVGLIQGGKQKERRTGRRRARAAACMPRAYACRVRVSVRARVPTSAPTGGRRPSRGRSGDVWVRVEQGDRARDGHHHCHWRAWACVDRRVQSSRMAPSARGQIKSIYSRSGPALFS